MLPLSVVQTLTERLKQAEIRYCHWKSNEHVNAAVQGKTDLDVLVDRSAKLHLPTLLSEAGFKYFEAIPCRRYTDIEDYLAIDADTGTLVHLHLHYSLELGEKQLKGYHLPWEEQILSSRIYNSDHKIYTAEPNIEIILLMVRAALKVRLRDRIKRLFNHNYFKGDFIREFHWLKQRIDLDQVRQLSETLLDTDAAKLILNGIQDESKLPALLRPYNALYHALQPYRRYHPLVAKGLRWQREFETLFYRLLRHYFHAPVTTRRTPTEGGLIVAFLGADGSGKSTVTQEVVQCLSQKLDVLPVYLGSGDGTASLLRLPLVWLTRSTKRSKKSPAIAQATTLPKPKSKLSTLVKLLWATTLVYEKRNKLKQSQQARARGMIVICDRYPQSQIHGFNDGPLLSDAGSLQQWEFHNYQVMAEKMPPDVVIKLDIAPEIAIARKPDSPAEMVRKKVAAIQSLQFPPQTKVITLDASESLNDVVLKAKQAVWENV